METARRGQGEETQNSSGELSSRRQRRRPWQQPGTAERNRPSVETGRQRTNSYSAGTETGLTATGRQGLVGRQAPAGVRAEHGDRRHRSRQRG